MFQTISQTFPEKDKLVHEIVESGIMWGNGYKMTLFKIDDFASVKYKPGAHSCSVISKNPLKSLNDKGLLSFHLKYIDYDYCLKRKNINNSRRGSNDIKRGYGRQYDVSDNKFLEEWDENKHNAILTSDYVNGKIKSDNASKYISSKIIINDNKNINSVKVTPNYRLASYR